MPTYIAMLKWTPQGMQNIRRSPARLEAAKQGFEAAGAKLKDFYLLTGRYDLLAIIEAPDDAVLATAILSTMSEGSVITETCRAFTEEEYRNIIGGLAGN